MMFNQRQLVRLLIATALAAPAVARAQAPAPAPVTPPPAEASKKQLGLSPGNPQGATLPGGVTPAFGQRASEPNDWRFDLHGFMTVPLRVGLGERPDPGPDQYQLTLHTPPLTPDRYGSFEYIALVPDTWAQLNFSMANSRVMATIAIAARSISNSTAFFEPPDQLGINDAFVTFNFDVGKSRFEWNVGAFQNRYGLMGEYDEGRYGTPLIGRLAGVGETLVAHVPLGENMALLFEHGLMGQSDKMPLGVASAGWNGFADPNVGSSFVHHAHAGLALGPVTLGAHYLTAWSQDERASAQLEPDGRITVLGAEARLSAGRFGHLFVGGARVDASQARSVSRVLSVLNAAGGPGLRQEYLGPKVTGALNVLGGQYDLSLGTLLRYPVKFMGDGPDIILSGFGMFTGVSSDDSAFDGVNKLKYGAEASYSMLSWLAVGARYDRVAPELDDDYQTFAVITPRVILRSDWNSQDQVAIQYSKWFDGSGVVVQRGYPAVDDPSIVPDDQTISISASMWF